MLLRAVRWTGLHWLASIVVAAMLVSTALVVYRVIVPSPAARNDAIEKPTAAPPANAPPCRAGDVELRTNGLPPGDTQDDGTLVEVLTHSNRPCELSGRPSATLTDTSGHAVALPTDPRMPPPPAPFADTGQRVFILPGRSALLWLFAPRSCPSNPGGGDQSAARYVAITVTIAGERVVGRGFSIPGTCGISISSFYQ